MIMRSLGPRLLLLQLLLSCTALAADGALTTRYVDLNSGRDEPECLNSTSLPCQSLHYVLRNQNISGLDVRVRPGEYVYIDVSGEIRLDGPVSLTIRADPDMSGEVVFRCSEQTQSRYNALAIFRGSNITIAGITVEECGPFPAGIYVEATEDVLIRNCTFRNNSGGGILLYNTKNIQVEDCVFANNTDIRPDLKPKEIPFNFGTQSAGGLGVLFDSTDSTVVKVQNCNFSGNIAGRSPMNANDSRPQSYAPFGHGGGFLVRFADYVSNVSVEVSDCLFQENRAIHSGGGIYIAMIQNPSNNHVVIRNARILNCTSDQTGGGLSLLLSDVGENNSVAVEGSHFEGCSAGVGGGAISVILDDSLASTNHLSVDGSTVLTVTDCMFNNNSSPTGGSAVGLVSNARVDQFSFAASIENCTFSGNQAKEQGAFLTFRFRVRLLGFIVFLKNKGGAMLVLQTKVDCQGQIIFEENYAAKGGAVTLEDQGLFNLLGGTEVVFQNNSAESVGGAILVNNPSVSQDVEAVYNTYCFLQYNVEAEGSTTLTPEHWNVNIKFLNNTAVEAGAAIYAYDLEVCLFTTTECQAGAEDTLPYNRSIFTENPPFIFEGNRVLGKEGTSREVVQRVATEPHRLSVSLDLESSAPGDYLSLQLQATDQSGNPRDALWTTEDDAVSEVFNYFSLPSSSMVYRDLYQVESAAQTNCSQTLPEATLTGDSETLEFFIIEGLTGEVAYKEKMVINTSCCHPGYHYLEENRTCTFDSHYSHLLRAHPDNRYVYLEHGYYAGFYQDTSRNETYFASALMPSSFQSCTREGGRTGCLYRFDHPDEQCKGKRTGFMCGSCPEGQGVDLTLRLCKKCGAGDTIGLVIVCILVVVGCTFVLIFNIGVPNDLIGFLFFAQVVGFVYQHGADEGPLLWDFHMSHMLGFSVYLPICPFTTLPALWTAAFGLLPCVLAILTVIVYIICARVIKPLGQRTVFRGIWLIILFVYKYIADTVANALKCVTLNGDDAHSRYALKLVFYYDGNVPCFSGEHLALAIPALLLLLFVVLLGPAIVILISFKRYKRTQAFTDVITDGVRLRMRWWGGFDLIRRLMFIVVITLVDIFQPDYAQFSLCLVSLVILGVLCFSKPYTDPLTNIIEAVILFNLLVISLIFLNTKESAKIHHVVFKILLMLPFTYAFINITTKAVLMLWKRYIPLGPKKFGKVFCQKLQSKLMPTKTKTRRKMMMKSSSTDYNNHPESDVDGLLEERDTGYMLYREELLESQPVPSVNV